MIASTVVGLLIPFLGTTLGAACVFVLKKNFGERINKALLGFASGVMVAASVWPLLIPAMVQCEDMGRLAFAPAVGGFLLGIAFLLLLDRLVPHLHTGSDEPEGPHCSLGKATMMVLAVTIHNIPEGMAVGLAFALASTDGGLPAAAALALGIGVQNLPEGAAVSLPLRQGGMSRKKSFLFGAASGLVEPVFGMLAALVVRSARMWMPGMMAFCAGAMMWVVIAEMIPEAAQGRAGVLGAMVGYALMMALDIALG